MPSQASQHSSQSHQSQYIPALQVQDAHTLPHTEDVVDQNRVVYSLYNHEDQNWLSKAQCFIRSEIIEVFRVKRRDTTSHQVGIRCRFCAHANTKATRASALSGRLDKLYQSTTMMVREHIPHCSHVPPDTISRLQQLQDISASSTRESRKYLIYAAGALGLMNGTKCIEITAQSRAHGATLPPFAPAAWKDHVREHIWLVQPQDRNCSVFLQVLLTQVQLIRLDPAEKIGSRRKVADGLPGLGCRSCCRARRWGLARTFVPQRRLLPQRCEDVLEHLLRCNVVAEAVKDRLRSLAHDLQGNEYRLFFDRVWERMQSD